MDSRWKSDYEEGDLVSLNSPNSSYITNGNCLQDNYEVRASILDDTGDCGVKGPTKNSLLAKKRLQAYSLNKFKPEPVKDEKAEVQQVEKLQKVSFKKSKKGLYHDDTAKAVIQEIEDLKKSSFANIVQDTKRPLPPACEFPIIKMEAVPVTKFRFITRSRSSSGSSDDNRLQFKKREIKCRNIRRNDVFIKRSISPDILKNENGEKEEKKTKAYPKNWAEYESLNLDTAKDAYIKSKLFKHSNTKNKKFELEKFFNFEGTSPLIEDFKCHSQSGQLLLPPPFDYLKCTATVPRIIYSRNIKSDPGYLTRHQITSIVPKDRLEILQKLWNSQLKCQPSNKKLTARKWYPKNWKKSENSEAKLLENSVGLSFLQTYSDEEEEDYEIDEKAEEKEIEQDVNEFKQDEPAAEKLLGHSLNLLKEIVQDDLQLEGYEEQYQKTKTEIEFLEISLKQSLTENIDVEDSLLGQTKQKIKAPLTEKEEKRKKRKKYKATKKTEKDENILDVIDLEAQKRQKRKKKKNKAKLIEPRDKKYKVKIKPRPNKKDKSKRKKHKKESSSEEYVEDSSEMESKKKLMKKKKTKEKIPEDTNDMEKNRTDGLAMSFESDEGDLSFFASILEKEAQTKKSYKHKKELADKITEAESFQSKTKKDIENKLDDFLILEEKGRKRKYVSDSEGKETKPFDKHEEIKYKVEEKKIDLLKMNELYLKEQEMLKLEEKKKEEALDLEEEDKIINKMPKSVKDKGGKNKKSLDDLHETKKESCHPMKESKNNRSVSEKEIRKRRKSGSKEDHQEQKIDKNSRHKKSSNIKSRSELLAAEKLELIKSFNELQEASAKMERKKATKSADISSYDDSTKHHRSVDEFDIPLKAIVKSEDKNTLNDEVKKLNIKIEHKAKPAENHKKWEQYSSSVWESEDEQYNVENRETVNRSWESDEDIFDRNNRNYSIKRSPIFDSMKLEIPLNIKPFSKRPREVKQKHIDFQFENALDDDLRRLQVEKMKLEQLEVELNETRSKRKEINSEKYVLKRKDSSENECNVERSHKKRRWDIKSSAGFKISTPKSNKYDEFDLSNNSSALENEYQEFIKAVSSETKPGDNSKEHGTILIESSSDSSITILEENKQEEKEEKVNIKVPHMETELDSKKDVKKIVSTFEGLLSKPVEVTDIPVMQIPLPPTTPVEMKPVPVPSPKLETIIDVNKPLINLSLSTNVTQNITLSLATSVSSISAPITSTINISKASVEISAPIVKDTIVNPPAPSSQNNTVSSTFDFLEVMLDSSKPESQPQSEEKSVEYPVQIAKQQEVLNYKSPSLTDISMDSIFYDDGKIEHQPAKKLVFTSLTLPSKRQLLDNSNLNLDESDDDDEFVLEERKRKRLEALIEDNQREVIEEVRQKTEEPVAKSSAQQKDRRSMQDSSEKDTARKPSSHKSPHREHRAPSPRVRRVSPIKRRDLSPRRKELSPRHRQSPKRKDFSPRRREASPKRRESPPKRKELSPRRRVPSPNRRPPSPNRRPPSPHRRLSSPHRRPPSPRRRDSPIKRREPSPKHRQSPLKHHEIVPRRPASPKHREPSPRRRDVSPRRRSPFRRRSPNKRGSSPRRRSHRWSPGKRSLSPRKRRSISPRRRVSISPRKDILAPHRGNERWRSPSPKSRRRSISPRLKMEGSPRRRSSAAVVVPPTVPSPVSHIMSPLEGLKRSVADSTISDDLLAQNILNEDFSNPPPPIRYHARFKETEYDSPKRISLDDRINQVLGLDVPKEPSPKPRYTHFDYSTPMKQGPGVQQYGGYQTPNPIVIGNVSSNSSFVANKDNSHKGQACFKQVGNMLQIVPSDNMPEYSSEVKPTAGIEPKPIPKELKPQIVQVGNMLQIVPTDIVVPPEATVVIPTVQIKSEKTEECSGDEIVVQEKQSAEAALMQKVAERRAERDKRRQEKELRRKEKEKRKKEKEKVRQAKLKIKTEDMIKRALQMEEEEEELDADNVENKPTQWPPLPVVVTHTFSKEVGKSILINRPGQVEANVTVEKRSKLVSFADGVRPGEGTSPSAGEELMSPPPKKLPKEKRFIKLKKVKKNQKKKKVKIIKKPPTPPENSDSEEDNLPPPSPPPGSPPPHIFPPRIKTAPVNNVTAAYLATIIQNSQQLQQHQQQLQQQMHQQQYHQQQLRQQQIHHQQIQHPAAFSSIYAPPPLSIIMAPPPPPPPPAAYRNPLPQHHAPPPPPGQPLLHVTARHHSSLQPPGGHPRSAPHTSGTPNRF